MAQALYRKYRSKTLDEVVGQDHVIAVLKGSLAKGRVAHAYLLTGPKGVGKTSIARILAHEINKLPYDDTTHLDIIEIDAASNNGVEDVRELREKVQIAPVSAEKKVYIIDEVHMLSKAAFNALLKTLEEPPEHAVFILATTDVDKLPATIISRVQRFNFRAITPSDATAHLRHIATTEGIDIDDDALELIASRGDGSFRDSISLLDQLSTLSKVGEPISRNIIEQTLGLAPQEEVAKLLEAYINKDLSAIVTLLNDSEARGVQPTILSNQLIHLVRSRIVEEPSLIELLDRLLDVVKSSQPAIKLLTILAANALPIKPKSVALAAPHPVISASVKELKKTGNLKPSTPPTNKKVSSRKITLPPSDEAPELAVHRITGELDWETLITYTKEHFVAVYSVLSKCSHLLEETTLKIYTGNAFYKKKLDDSKYRAILTKCLMETGAGEWHIETIATPPPPKDSVAASVAAIMGGGEEVHVGNDETPSA